MMDNNTMRIAVNYNKLSKRLKDDYHYTTGEVLHTVWGLIGCKPEVKEAFVKWFNDGIEPRLIIEGVTWSQLVNERGLNPYNAFLTINFLMKDPSTGFALLPRNIGRMESVRVDELRPDLQKYVEEHRKEHELPEPPVDDNGDISL